MNRRDFLKAAAAVGFASAMGSGADAGGKLPRRPLGKTGERLSIIGLGGIVLIGQRTEQRPTSDRGRPSIAESTTSTSLPATATAKPRRSLGPALEAVPRQGVSSRARPAGAKAGAREGLPDLSSGSEPTTSTSTRCTAW